MPTGKHEMDFSIVCIPLRHYQFVLIGFSTTNQASNLAKSMCHEILKEEDDEVASLDDDGVDVCVNKAHLDELLDETNGNISAKLTTLTLNDNIESAVATATGQNGNNIAANDSDRTANNNKSKKKSKKGAKLSDSNDNKLDEDNNTSTSEANDGPSSADILKDDAINVNA